VSWLFFGRKFLMRMAAWTMAVHGIRLSIDAVDEAG
jgi:hypothetical protein